MMQASDMYFDVELYDRMLSTEFRCSSPNNSTIIPYKNAYRHVPHLKVLYTL